MVLAFDGPVRIRTRDIFHAGALTAGLNDAHPPGLIGLVGPLLRSM